MKRIVVFGNSGSGKSTYAKAEAKRLACAHLDLDTLAWDISAEVPTRLPLEVSAAEIRHFIVPKQSWIIEGCYADLLHFALPFASKLVFLNPGVETCVTNARNRPWEPHKYPSKDAQDANLDMLIGWIRDYKQRDDEFSYAAHRRLFDSFDGEKLELTSNAR